ncbi:hypothetical protein NFI99_14265 (plasmid) [Burkholderia glumae]|uniref:Uncharacterized protein n=1 Tax=Burkholderia glumae TaxID=337 RepID=A0ABY5BD25_BURGL|nr:hypothetical protein [Burkholderia glumae]USS44428.1 hypothetical protein NFI99_14265 [Burkholderia glumae]
MSYNTVALRATDGGQPRVGTFNWDLTGASYLGPLTQWDKAANKKKPGYLVCDVLLGVNVAAHELQPFINKCTSLRALAKVGRCMQVFVADGYTPEAFALACEGERCRSGDHDEPVWARGRQGSSRADRHPQGRIPAPGLVR